MPVETADDRLAMLADFGVAATIGAASVTGIFDDEFEIVELRGEIPVSSTAPRFLCRSADVTAVTTASTVIIGGATYYVRDIQADGTGLTSLILSR